MNHYKKIANILINEIRPLCKKYHKVLSDTNLTTELFYIIYILRVSNAISRAYATELYVKAIMSDDSNDI